MSAIKNDFSKSDFASVMGSPPQQGSFSLFVLDECVSQQQSLLILSFFEFGISVHSQFVSYQFSTIFYYLVLSTIVR
ncbi:MAG TPA: hypothetical protein VJ697_08355 [Nitrososphaeraceae archaeon]|nr:hypothetical protein [Nitrososphaeraceae archaeon]